MPDAVAMPPSHEWVLTNRRRGDHFGERRTFTQQELTIEGEARLIAIIHEVAVKLSETDFAWERVPALFDEGPVDWSFVIDIVGRLPTLAPDAMTDAVVTMFGIYPTEEDGSKNADFDSDTRFIKSSISVPMFVDILRVFTEQNDYRRMADPIGAILGREAGQRMADKLNPTNTNGTSPDAETSGGS